MPDLQQIVRAIHELDPGDLPIVLNAITQRMVEARSVPTENGHDRLLTAQEVAKRVNLGVAWVRANGAWLQPARVVIGGAVRYSESALEKLLRDRRGT